ncbi:hypothetical protein NX99_01350 [Streptococcus salivarius]|uniref:hypothetical protein n=1 Tax=Streptococcus salivarius TaxID=1304 RepID=UPI000A092296|nr:hypothetical protein [Streptococcus salivarius]ARI57168.1 hypothetical protein NX99_01350 [Streptococcus salivarius]
MIDRSYLPFQSAREHQDRGMMKWMGFFLSEHTSSLHEDKTKEDLTSHLGDLEKFTLLNQLYTGQLLGDFQIKNQDKRCRFSGYVVELNLDRVTIKSCKQYKHIKIKHILEISLGVEGTDEEEEDL